MAEGLIPDGHQVRGVGHIGAAQAQVESGWPDVVLLDLYLDGPQGFGFLEETHRRYPELPVVIVTAYDSFRRDPRLSNARAYVMKNLGFLGELRNVVARAVGEESVQAKSSDDHVEIAPALSPNSF